MRWLDRFRRHHPPEIMLAPLDLPGILEEGLRDIPSAQEAITRLIQEQQNLTRQQRVIEKQFKQLSPVRIRNMARSGPALGSYELSQAMDDANIANQDSAIGEQVVTIENRRREIDLTIRTLRRYIGHARQG